MFYFSESSDDATSMPCENMFIYGESFLNTRHKIKGPASRFLPALRGELQSPFCLGVDTYLKI